MRPPLARFRRWLAKETLALEKLPYETLLALPEEAEIDGPFIHPDVRYFIRREVELHGDRLTPIGTVRAVVSVDVYENGAFSMRQGSLVEMTPRGRVLNPLRGWDRRD